MTQVFVRLNNDGKLELGENANSMFRTRELILIFLQFSEWSTVQEIARGIFRHPNTVSSYMTKLEREKFVESETLVIEGYHGQTKVWKLLKPFFKEGVVN